MSYRTSLSLLFVLVLLIPVYSAADDTAISLSNWNYDISEIKKSAAAHDLQLVELEPKKARGYDNYILKYLLTIDDEALSSIQILKTKSSTPYRDFLLYKGRLCAVSCRNETSTPEDYQTQFSFLKKNFGSPETKRTESSVTHTFVNEETTVLFMVNTKKSAIATRTYLYPTDLFKRILFPVP